MADLLVMASGRAWEICSSGVTLFPQPLSSSAVDGEKRGGGRPWDLITHAIQLDAALTWEA